MIEEVETGDVAAVGGLVQDRPVQGPAEGIAGQDVEAAVADERGGAGHRVEHALHTGRDRRLAAPSWGAHGLGGAGEVEQVLPLGVVELQGTGDGVEDVVGHAADVALLQADIPVGADPGEHGDLFAAQPGHSPPPGGR